MTSQPLTAEYPNKHYVDFTQEDRRAQRRYDQGKNHAMQGRTDFLGECPHYDAGFYAYAQA